MLSSTAKLIVPKLLVLFGKGMPLMPPALLFVVYAIVPGADQSALPFDALSDGAVAGQLRDGIIIILIVKVIEPEP